MSRHISASADLATKYAVGEIVDMLGVPQYYDAGSSQWMQGNVWFPVSAVSAAVADLLRRTPGNAAITAQSVQSCYGGGFAPAVVGSVAVASTAGHGAAVLLITEAGTQLIDIGVAASVDAVQVVSDGTYFWAFAVSGGWVYPRIGHVKRSVDGRNWVTPPGVFSISGANGSGYSVYDMNWSPSYPGSGAINGMGHSPGTVGANYGIGVLWCGARFLSLALDSNGTYVSAWRAQDGLAWGNPDATAVLGSSGDISAGARLHFHRGSGLKCCMQVGNSAGRGWRYTTDGGVTWGHSTVSSRIDPSQTRKRLNTTSQDKLIFAESGGSLLVTADCGANYIYKSAQDTGISGVQWVAYKGSRIFLASSYGVVTSMDDGTAWNAFSLPSGFSGQVSGFVADETVFYLTSSTGQLFISLDGETWTQRILPVATSAVYAARLGNQIVVGNSNVCIISNDGGVTWAYALLAQYQGSGMQGPMYKVTTGAVSRLIGAGGVANGVSPIITSQMLTAGAAAVRAGQTSPNSLRGSTTPMIRVA